MQYFHDHYAVSHRMSTLLVGALGVAALASSRTSVPGRKASEALAPPAVGWAADSLFSGGAKLRDALLALLIPLVLGWIAGLFALETFPSDVATAAENARRFPAQ